MALRNGRTLPELFAARVAETPLGEAYRECDEITGAWTSTSWAETAVRVGTWSQALGNLGLPRGARVAILLRNGLDAVCADMSALTRALVPVPMHVLDNPESIAFIIGDSEAALLVAESDVQWQAVASVRGSRPSLRQVVVLRKELTGPSAADAVPVAALAEWLSHARAASEIDVQMSDCPTEADLAALVYTSGTTGRPKGRDADARQRGVQCCCSACARRTVAERRLSLLPAPIPHVRADGRLLPADRRWCLRRARPLGSEAE